MKSSVFESKFKLKILFLLLILFLGNISVFAQTDSVSAISIEANVDLVSRYIWRGQDYGQAPSIQPDLSVTWKDFTVGAWGAYKFTGAGMQETDIYLSKSFGHFTVSLWDYWSFCDTTFTDYFNYKRGSTMHQLEAQVLISGGENLPFNLLGSYFFYGSDTSNSAYLELQYHHSIGSLEMQLFAGYQPWGTLYATKASFVIVGCTVIKTIDVTRSWSLPLSLGFIINPSAKSAYLVAGITL